MLCSKCGSELEYDKDCCEFCFTELTPQQMMLLEQEKNQKLFNQTAGVRYKRKKTLKTLLTVISVIIVLIISSAVIYKIVCGKNLFVTAKNGLSGFVNSIINNSAKLEEKESTLEEKVAKIKEVALEALTESKNTNLLPDQNLDEYVTELTVEKLNTYYADEFKDAEIKIFMRDGQLVQIRYDEWIVDCGLYQDKIYSSKD